MSNQLVGSVYTRVIEDVIQSCHVTFEEDGVDQQTLDDLRATWQKRLTALNVGSFPWEPPPAPQPMANPAPVPSNVPRPQQLLSSAPPPTPVSAPYSNPPDIRIKAEPQTAYDNQGISLNNGLPMSYPPQTAQQRAAQQLDQRFGDRARPQINQLQAQAALVGSGQQLQQRPPNAQLQPQRQQIGEQQRIMLEQQRRQQQQQQHYQQLQQAQQRSSINNAQTDGAGDWNAMVAQRRADALRNPNGMHEANLTIREQVEQASQAREGGGLMLPMSEHSKKPKSKKSGFVRSTAVSSLHSAQPTDFSHMPKIPQYDGGDESEEDDKTGIKDDPDPEPTPEPDLDLDDEDAINSDLDDPDDNVVEEGEDDGKEGEIMLCTYDKVQRVKNKWKCTLKDGVLTTGGREYVFHKAQGEFEW
ncbi:transcription factor IIA subunit alpha [Toensbergia leucococca]|nr:transcription factor IIA subunit alpha [Toensbergia leucococca]